MKQILENVKVNSVTPYSRNARKNDHAVQEVVKSIERTGYRSPILVDENMVVLAGHVRLKAIKAMGWKEIPFIVQFSDLTEEQKLEYRIRDNKTAEIAEWDYEILEEDFPREQLEAFGFIDKGINDVYEEWKGMPEFEMDGGGAYRDIIIHFTDKEAVEKFSQLIGHPVTDTTKYIWFPELVRDKANARRYVSQDK